MDALVDDLSVLGRVYGGRFATELEPTTIAAIAAAAVAGAPATPDGRRPSLGPPTGDVAIETASAAVARALGALASCALRLAPRQPEIVVRAVAGAVVIGPLAPDAARGLVQPGRDVRLAAAHALLGETRWALVIAGDEARVAPAG